MAALALTGTRASAEGATSTDPVVRGPASAPLRSWGSGTDPGSAQAETTQAVVTFSGFQPLPTGGARVFLHLTAKPAIEVSADGDKVIVRLAQTSVGVRNNRNPLDVSQFNLPLLRTQLVTRGQNVEWVLTLRAPAKLDPTFVETARDGVSLEIEIPTR